MPDPAAAPDSSSAGVPRGADGHDRLAALEARYERLRESRRTGPIIAVVDRFLEAEGLAQGALLSLELFTTVIPLVIIGFGWIADFSSSASVGDMFIRNLGVTDPLDDTVRAAFGTADGLASTWTVVGLAGFLFWGIPMSLTVSNMFTRAWRREPFGVGERLGRGAGWFVLYLVTMGIRLEISSRGLESGSAVRAGLYVVTLLPAWLFWAASPYLLVRDGGRAVRPLVWAGLAGVAIDAVILPAASKIVFPSLLAGWNGFGPIGVAMTLMTWCGVLGVGWVVTACAGAIIWERIAPETTVVEAQTADPGVPAA